jgi:outer membrane receptor protein involved in Fe transport
VIAGDTSKGDISLGELAADGQYEHGPVRVDLAGGIALPVGVGADPWPEAKLAVKVKPHQDVEVTATTGYKGRVPSLRERFDSATGNPKLGPEFSRHAEVRTVWEGLRTEALGSPGDAQPRVRFEVAPFVRKSKGSSRLCVTPDQCPDGMVGRLEALDDTFFYGVDTMARVKVIREVEVGAAFNYIKGCELESGGCDEGIDPATGMRVGGADPLDRLPRRRADAWVQVSPTPKIATIARAKYFGRAIDKGDVTGAYVLVEASVSAQVTKQYLGVLRVDDALDVRPETRSGFHMPGRVVSFVFQGTWE